MMHSLIAATAWLIALAWLYKFVESFVGYPKVPNLLDAKFEVAPAGDPSVVVIVPARNEATHVAACLGSLLAQDYVNMRVIAVDDRSTDATGSVLDRLAAEHPKKLTVLHIAELPAGWLGKTHAMAVAADSAIAQYSPDYLLFTDADIHFQKESIRRALAQAVATSADHFVLMPTLIVRNAGEAMVLSYIQTMSLWGLRPWRVADPRARRDAIGVGAFNMVRAAAYLQIGGFEATPMEVLEDLYLGRRIKWAGLSQRVAVAPGMIQVHWAPGASGIVRGLTKNIFALFRFRPLPLLAAAIGTAIISLAPFALLALPETRIPAFVALASIAGVYALSARISRISPFYAVLFPFAAGLVVYAMLRSMLVTLQDGGVTWRGTFYPLDELRRHMVRALQSNDLASDSSR
jgi:GT2 family glycosyltransferase